MRGLSVFGWLFGRCPVDPAAKRWVEDRLLWLRDEFGADDLYGPNTVLPTPEFFPERYDGSRPAVRALFARVCDLMGVDPTDVRLKFLRPAASPLFLLGENGEQVPTEAAGLYQARVIRLNEGGFGDPLHLVGTMAHELAHQRLLGEGRLDPGAFDNELLTDLLVVFKGLGVFVSAGDRYYAGQDRTWPGTDLRRPEYMTPPLFGYALGVLAWVRGEERPPCRPHLASGVRGEFDQTVRFLRKTGDCRIRPIRRPR